MKKAKISIDKHGIVSDVDPRIYGSFLEHLGRAVYEGIYQPGQCTADEQGFRRDTLEVIRELNVPVIRYPGGNFVSGYRWEDGTGPKDQRPSRLDLAWSTVETNEFGLNEFMDWCKKANISPMMAINLGTRGIESAMDILDYCNHPSGTYWSDLRIKHGYKDPHNIKLWCLGNEMDGPWQMGHKTAYEYGRLANEVGAVMKRYDPTLELVACGSSGIHMKTFGEWEREVLTECYGVADYISLHMYWRNDDKDTPRFLAESVNMDRFISEVVSICDYVKSRKQSKKQVNLSFDEWNPWYHNRHAPIEAWSRHPHQEEELYNMEDALLVGSALITLLRHADRVKIACMAQLVNVIAPIMTSDNHVWRQTIFYPYMHVSTMGLGRVLNTLVDTPTYECSVSDHAPYLDSVVVENEEEETLTVFAVNKSEEESMELSCDLRQYADYTVAEHLVLENSDRYAVNTEEDPFRVVPQTGGISKNDKGNFTAVLNPLSWNVIRLKKTR
ncbi:MAG: alpha-N-arabinofuranosidase [Clostridia bacterium]|nr:alpha-N-arabinofuranosidase [Clostridia bacterium]